MTGVGGGPDTARRLITGLSSAAGWIIGLSFVALLGYVVWAGPLSGALTRQSALYACFCLALALLYLPPVWRGLDRRGHEGAGVLGALRYLVGLLRLLLAPVFLLLVWRLFAQGLPAIDDGVAYGSGGCPEDAKPRGAPPPDGSETWCERRPDGERQGPYNAYWPNGAVKVAGLYVDGGRDGIWTRWYQNGQLQERLRYRAGVRHGEWLAWHPDGTKAAEGNYVDGGLDGHVQRWHPNGRTDVDMIFERGRPPLAWQEYFPDGTPVGEGSMTLIDELPTAWRRAVCVDDPAKIERRQRTFVMTRVGRSETLTATSVRRDPITGALRVRVSGSVDWAPAHLFLDRGNGRWEISEPFAPYPLRPWVEADRLEEYRDGECR